jgi:protein-L-isoaspartate O-methyltransferase
MVGLKGKVFTVEYRGPLACLGDSNLREYYKDEFAERFKVVHGDGSVGLKEDAPFDRIYFTAGIERGFFDMSVLSSQLKPERGILLIPEKMGQMIKQTYEDGNMTKEEMIGSVGFVPLAGVNS